MISDTDMSVCKFIVKFAMPLTSLIKRSVQPFEKKKKNHIFYKILSILQWRRVFFLGGIFCCYCGGGGALRLGLSCQLFC